MENKPDAIEYLLFNDEHARKMRELKKEIIERIKEFAEKENIEHTTTVRMMGASLKDYHAETRKRGSI